MIQILALLLYFEGAHNIMSFESSFGALEDAGDSWLEFDILFLSIIWSLVFDTPLIEILATYLDFEVAKNIVSFKSLFGALWDAGDSWLGFGLLIWIWSLAFDIPVIQILALFLDSEGAKNTHVL